MKVGAELWKVAATIGTTAVKPRKNHPQARKSCRPVENKVAAKPVEIEDELQLVKVTTWVEKVVAELGKVTAKLEIVAAKPDEVAGNLKSRPAARAGVEK